MSYSKAFKEVSQISVEISDVLEAHGFEVSKIEPKTDLRKKKGKHTSIEYLDLEIKIQASRKNKKDLKSRDMKNVHDFEESENEA